MRLPLEILIRIVELVGLEGDLYNRHKDLKDTLQLRLVCSTYCSFVPLLLPLTNTRGCERGGLACLVAIRQDQAKRNNQVT
jgi:hypothetical protein